MILDTFMKSGVLTLAGMFVVFAFMLCMMMLVSGLIRLSERFFPDAKEAEPGRTENAKSADVDRDAIVAAIAAGMRSRK
jgi:Na+-transporting methylmalonyl-CoA/oxaloacetate decarboxylase gamma subunit